MNMTREQIESILQSEESETIERKKGFDAGEIRKALIAFANDLAGRDVAWLIIGQAPDRQIVGLSMDADKAQRKISDIARDQCIPAIPVSMEIYEQDGKRVAIVEVRRSIARPHFEGKAWVRIGSTTRRATDAEIILLRSEGGDKKVATIRNWIREGKTSAILLDAKTNSGMRITIQDVTDQWVKLDFGTRSEGLPLAEMKLGYNYEKDCPILRSHSVKV